MTTGKKLEHAAVLTAALMFASLLYQDWVRVHRGQTRFNFNVRDLIGGTPSAFDPVKVGRRYYGKVTDSPRPVDIELQFTALQPPRVTAEIRAKNGKAGRFWSGSYNTATRSLLLQDSSSEQITLNYTDNGSWLGSMKIPKSLGKGMRKRSQEITIPIRFDSK